MKEWRTGRQVPINVYDGDRPVCQCHTASDARLIVEAVNGDVSPAQRQELRCLVQAALRGVATQHTHNLIESAPCWACEAEAALEDKPPQGELIATTV